MSRSAGRARLRPLAAGDIQFVAEHMRGADRAELAAVHGEQASPLHLLAQAVLNSPDVWTGVTADGEPICICGVAPRCLLTGSASPWLLGTEKLFTEPGALVREGHRYIGRMRLIYPELVNYVDARNTKSIRWLRRLGFTVHPAEPYGRAGLPFHRFDLVT